MIELYAKGTTDFSKHGIALAGSEASVTWQENGRYDMDMSMPYDPQIMIDYGMILRAPVPAQHVDTITLGEVSYWEIGSGLMDVPLYSRIPTLKKVGYQQWTANRTDPETTGGRIYQVGDKVTYLRQNYQMIAYDPGSDMNYNHPPDNYPQYWEEIQNTVGKEGKIAALLDAGDQIVKTGDYNSRYMKAADTSGHMGFIEISKCVDKSQSGTRTISAFDITEQSFVITEIEKTTDGRKLTVHAEHISYQLGRTMLGDCNISRATPATALMFIRGAMQENYPGEVETNLTEDDGLITGDFSWKNAQNAILDPKSGILQATNAYIIRRDMDVYVLKMEEAAPRYRITYGTNMKAVKWDGNTADLVTRVYPLAQTEDGETFLLPELYIDTVREVPFIRPEALKTGLKIGQEEEQEDGTKVKLDEDTVIARMREAAQNRFAIDECDKVVITLDVDWQHIPDTAEYAEYAALQDAAPGEWVEVRNAPLGIFVSIQMTGYTWDPIRKRYKKGTFGKKKTSPSVAGYDIQSGAVTGRALAAGAVGGQNIQAGAITAREIEANAITADRIASRSIVTELLAAGAVTADELNAGAVTAEKIAAYAVTAEKIAAGAITADKIVAYAITAEKIAAGAITADKIAAGAITAIKIDTNSISAINAKLGTATIENGIINNADISYADIVDASIQSLIARDAVTDKYFIDKLQVRNLQSVEATVGELVIKASDNKYYRLDVGSGGTLTPTEVTPTAAEIAAGVTSNGHGAIIETDLTVADLSASNIKGINALIDKLTASRIDVSELWARQAFINQLMVTDISSNTYIQSTIGNWESGSTITQKINSLDSRISSLGYGTVYMQPEEPSHSELVPGDIWIQTQPSGTWAEVYDDYATWQTIYTDVSTWQTLGGVSIMWVWDGRKWQKQLDNLDSDTFQTEIEQNAYQISLLASRTTTAENNITSLTSSLQVANDAISAEVRRATTAEDGKLDKTSSYQTADAIVTAAQTYTNNKLTSYSTISQTADAISAYVTNNAYGKVSGITITASGIDISGSQYVKIASGGYFQVKTGDFGIDSNSADYVVWSGASTAAASNFRVKKDGSVYLTKLVALGEDGTESNVNLRTAGLWKLGYHTIKSYAVSGGYVTSITLSNGTTVNFKHAVSVALTGSWNGSTFTVTETGSGETYSETLRGDTGTGYGNADTFTIDSFSATHFAYGRVYKSSNQGGGVLFGFKVDASGEYDAGWVAGYNAAAAKFAVTGYTNGSITFPVETDTAGDEKTQSWDITADVTNPAQGYYMGIAYINYIRRASRSRQFS